MVSKELIEILSDRNKRNKLFAEIDKKIASREKREKWRIAHTTRKRAMHARRARRIRRR